MRIESLRSRCVRVLRVQSTLSWSRCMLESASTRRRARVPILQFALRRFLSFIRLLMAAMVFGCAMLPGWSIAQEGKLRWDPLPDLPNELGVAGPFVGVASDVLLVAGGANFPLPVWETQKQWHANIYALRKTDSGYTWSDAGSLPRNIGYGANVSTDKGIVCIGGNDTERLFAECFIMSWDANAERAQMTDLPSFPMPLAYGQACQIGDTIYVGGGQTTADLSSAIRCLWSINLGDAIEGNGEWKQHADWPGPARAFNIVVTQNNGFDDCLYLIGGRYQIEEEVHFLDDCWEYNPKQDRWRERAKLPQPVTAGTGIRLGQSHIAVLSGDTGSLFHQTDELRDEHPGFPKVTFGYHAITDTWISLGPSPANQVTTTAVEFDGAIVVPTGEVRPRVRSPKVWRVTAVGSSGVFGWLDYSILAIYLAVLIAIGFYFSRRTKSTEDYFRGAGKIPWWAAGCSIFATMLSSLTFTGVPSKAFAQDWVYAIGNFMIPVVAVVAVFVALPFYRKIDATSAYEYLEKRFGTSIRLFGSLSFSTFHLFRMAIVMSLTALALAVATPLTPVQSVLLMGALSIVYCSMGGVSAVIWTDTLQTFVLLGGAAIAIALMLSGTGQSFGQSWSTALSAEKLNMANWHVDATDAQVALWAIVIGAIGQNLSSYTADQAVVQRYMTTPSEALAARAIWTNAILTIPATLLFFGIGTSLFLYYQAHPDRLDPTLTTDQVFPLFISREMPSGLAGLIVAAIFAAAQSTVSTSMNSVATTLVTDCIRPFQTRLSERTLLRLAQLLTVVLGAAGTLLALSFVNPDIRSLFDQFIKVIGLFMGVLGGLFILGVLFPRANTLGAWIGAISGATVMLVVWKFTTIHGYLYTVIGIATCVTCGLLGSLAAPKPEKIEQLCLS